ncbi:gp53-like domain-containing protein [Methylobacterium durans]|uniref:Putative tail fiber protein gp53-like C-terminal domain-containing protein n=1 Tax=Methylobacterium durans TaxID=2202825 RepID=A0A2U8WC49_9HYPH|nr:hypothetical protein [Methylobacterium durans]AWN43181.1 hypothetical protein DK389_25140 [Methylobacterium durans]
MRRLGDSGTLGTGETSIASAATTNIGSLRTRDVLITGTTTITSFGTTPNRDYRLRFAASLTLTHNATSLILPGLANIVTAAGDCCLIESDVSGNHRVTSYQPADRTPKVPYITAAVVGNPGYRKWSNGLIEQWGTVAGNSAADVSVTFPTPFIGGVFSVQTSVQQPSTATTVLESANPYNLSLTGFSVAVRFVSGSSVARGGEGVHWFAVGN